MNQNIRFIICPCPSTNYKRLQEELVVENMLKYTMDILLEVKK